MATTVTNVAIATGTPRFKSKSFLSSLGVVEWSSVVVALVVFSFIVAALNVSSYLKTHSLSRYRLSPGDEVAVSKMTKDLSSYLCSDYEVSMEGEHRGAVYLLDARQRLETRRDTQRIMTMSGLNGTSHYRYKSFYLQETSRLVVTACHWPEGDVNHVKGTVHQSHDHAQLSILKGHKALDKWLKTSDKAAVIKDYAMGFLDLRGKYNCSEGGLDVYIQHPDTYYVIMTTAETEEFIGRVDISLERQYYSISQIIDSCYQYGMCTFSLPYAQPVEVVVLLGDNQAEPDSPVYLSTLCQPRFVFWAAVFGAPPIITVIGAMILCYLHRRGQVPRQRKGKDKLAFQNQALDNTSLTFLKDDREQPV